MPPDALSGDLSRHDLHAAMLLHLMPKPTIAMVGGPAVGAGCSLAAACDLRFASEDAVFAANFSPNGLSGDYGGSFFWTRIGGTALARRLYLLNEKIPAPRALELGMVHAVLPAAELRAYTYEIASQLVRTPATLLALVKDNLNAAEDEVERRRWLFAHEAENQATSAEAMMERMAKKQKAADEAPGTEPAEAGTCRRTMQEVAAPGLSGHWSAGRPTPTPARPLHSPTVAAMAHRIPDGEGPALVNLHAGTSSPKCWRMSEQCKKTRRIP